MKFPRLERRGLGVGLDLPWGDGSTGFAADHLAAPVRSYLQAGAASWSHAFFSWQPRDRALPTLGDYAAAWDDLITALPSALPRALHQTSLNLAALGSYRRTEIFDFTNALCERYCLRWVNEDVGFWSLAGRPLPYPLPPLLDDEGLSATIANVRACQ